MARTLEDLKDALWQQFEKASCKRYSDPEDGFIYYGEGSAVNNHTIANRQVIAQLAQAIVAVEQEQRLQQEAREKPTNTNRAPVQLKADNLVPKAN